MTAKPNMTNAWAEAGTVATPSASEIQIGWEGNDIPPAEIENFVQNRQDNAIKYIFEQGVVEWDNTTLFPVDAYVKRNGVVYRSLLSDSNKDPLTQPTYWTKAFDDAGSAQAVQDIVDEITDTDGYLDFYVQHSDPTLTTPLTAPKTFASDGIANGYKFKSATDITAENSGIVYSSGNVDLVLNGVVKGRITPAMDVNTNDVTLVTTQMLRSVILDFCFPVGCLHITEQTYDPSVRFGGSWTRVAKGRAIVGRHDGVTSDIPDWVKTAGNQHGEYEVTLAEENMVAHVHNQRASSDATAGNLDKTSLVTDTGQSGIGQTIGVTTDSFFVTNKAPLTTTEWGGDEDGDTIPLELVQPSEVYNIWKRIG